MRVMTTVVAGVVTGRDDGTHAAFVGGDDKKKLERDRLPLVVVKSR